LFVRCVCLFGEFPPSLSHFFQNHTVPLRHCLFSKTVAFLRKYSVLSSRVHADQPPGDSPVPTAERHTAWNPERPRVYRQTARGGMIHCGTFAGAAEKVPMEGKQSRLAMTWSLVRLRCDACKRAGCKRLLCGTLHFLLPGGAIHIWTAANSSRYSAARHRGKGQSHEADPNERDRVHHTSSAPHWRQQIRV